MKALLTFSMVVDLDLDDIMGMGARMEKAAAESALGALRAKIAEDGLDEEQAGEILEALPLEFYGCAVTVIRDLGFCSRTCCEDWHGVERRPTANMGMHYETREEVRYQ